MKKILTLALFLSFCFTGKAQEIQGPIKVHPDQRYLTTSEGKPFFWMADTAWELFHRLDEEEAKFYLNKRKEQGFNVVQAVVLAELDGINSPNANGDLPFIDPSKWQYNEAYFEHVDKILNLALEREIHLALLPTWGDKLFKNSWGIGPEIFTPETAYAYGKWIGNRYRNQKNLIWVLGGDRNPRENSLDVEVWNQMAKGILETQNPSNPILITFHPQPAEPGGSSNWFHSADWLSFNMHQTGHCPNQPTYEKISHDLALSPQKPSIDGEPMYEEHPKCFNAKELGYSEAADIRRIMYWNVFAGAAGQSYGCHAVWQMYDLDKDPVNAPLKPWHLSLELEVANQVKHLKNLLLSRDFFDRIPDQSLIHSPQNQDDSYVSATRSKTGQYAFIYFPDGKTTLLDLSTLKGPQFKLTWYDPRIGITFPESQINQVTKANPVEIKTPSQGRGNDWVLIIDALD
ncbi:collagenase-like protein with putative collagen-binding domain [Algoriphagus boseongensis]|uniref:Collagenase-like protein with putative collagen-binding domain n=1 Tax=Algoriphagus boseongensis TaxID=1442587 RepID=A0A4R6T226_9BACT|nr:glycoside hydrolase family 140 protein [Algoriphagus boseongensis]TDQ15042.1 collagenase-like protein with putative collagen-binding domain [Algoriphagus boseongensis]